MDNSEVYKEACASFRHYSKAALTLRVSVIAQGMVLLSASSYLYKNQEFIYSIFTALFGIIFTFALLILHSNYQRKCAIFISNASLLEEKSEEVDINIMSVYNEDHNQHVKTTLGEITIANGLFVVMLIAFTVLVVLSATKC